ncbi:MAG: putative DNA modification/repair radical SAM protein [Oscillospiraceae bacterium]|nr:putative DNA modification/repair radical SAM protein [Oscillospiraceae bacterium]
MDVQQKLTILADSAKYDAACTSSGAQRSGGRGMGNTVMAGCCHSFSEDGRCISLLKVLMTNHCVYDCKYCVNRRSNDVPRAAFTPEELAELTIQFYRRNYIEGLFLSSGVFRSPDYTTEQMIATLELLRRKYNFWGYIHAKAIPNTSQDLIYKLGLLADRISVNIEFPSEQSLNLLAPNKSRKAILAPMGQITQGIKSGTRDLALYRNAPRFASAGQSTQMIIGASPESDYHIIKLSAGLYDKYQLKRVFYSAYIPKVQDALLPAAGGEPPLLREHRLYQADWLLRKYGFAPDEILSEETPNFNPFMDPKCNWAVNNMQLFPIDVNTAPKAQLLRVPGIGPTSAARIVTARRTGRLSTDDLKRMGVVLKRARYFIAAKDQPTGYKYTKEGVIRSLIDPSVFSFGTEQLSLFTPSKPAIGASSVIEAAEEAILCLKATI